MRPQDSDTLEGRRVPIEGDDIMTGLDEAARHGKTHVSQPDKPDVHFARLVFSDRVKFGASLASDAWLVNRRDSLRQAGLDANRRGVLIRTPWQCSRMRGIGAADGRSQVPWRLWSC